MPRPARRETNRMKWTRLIVGAVAITGLAAITSFQFGIFEMARLHSRIDELEKEKGELKEFARRLGAARRVAQVDVLSQEIDETGTARTSMRWQQRDENETLGVPEQIEIVGTQAYFEAFVIKFTVDHVGKGDANRDTSLCLFRRAFGDRQTPESGAALDRATPPLLAGTAEEASRHSKLWARFWDIVDDPKVAAEFGVRVAQIEAPAVPVKAGEVWEITLDAAGGLNLRKIGMRLPPGSPTSTRAMRVPERRDTIHRG